MGRPKQQESITTFAEVINRSNSYPHQSNRVNNNDNRLMIYFQGLKLYIPDDFQPDTLLELLQTMKRFAADADHIFLACGATDFRKQIPGLVASVTLQFQLDPYNGNYVFIFCNRKRDAIKVLRYDRNGGFLKNGFAVSYPRTAGTRRPDYSL